MSRSALALVLASILVFVGCSDDGQPTVIPPPAGGDAGADDEGGTGALKQNAEPGCTRDDECESNVCFIGGRQSFCSVPCTSEDAPTVCAAPFSGSCNNRGFCKRD